MNAAFSACDAGSAPHAAALHSAKETHPSMWAARLRAAIDGDESEYPHLLDDIGHLARKVARRMVARWNFGEAIVEDIVQETLIAVHLKRGAWDCSKPVEPWVAILARNKAIDAIRRTRIGREAKVEALEQEMIALPEATPDAQGDVRKLLMTLKPRQREIVTAVMLREESVADVAARLAMTDMAIRVALHRAVKSMGAVAGAIRNPPRRAAIKKKHRPVRPAQRTESSVAAR